MAASIEVTAKRAETLRGLHSGPGTLVLPNAWDAASAKIVAAAGFSAIATTSAGVANSLGFEDHQKAPLDEMPAAAARVVAAVDVPGELVEHDDFSQPAAGFGAPLEQLRVRCPALKFAESLRDQAIEVRVDLPPLRGGNLLEPELEHGLVHV